jgi:hypothetical protein
LKFNIFKEEKTAMLFFWVATTLASKVFNLFSLTIVSGEPGVSLPQYYNHEYERSRPCAKLVVTKENTLCHNLQDENTNRLTLVFCTSLQLIR